MKYKIVIITLMIVAIAGYACFGAAEFSGKQPVEITADAMSYDTVTGVATADGNVKMQQGGAVVTGNHAEYNKTTDAAKVTGNVNGSQDGSQIACNELQLLKQEQVIAIGAVHASSNGYKFSGERLEYYLHEDYVFSPQKSTVSSVEGDMTSGALKYFTKAEHGFASGGVLFNSQKRNIVASSQSAEYIGGKNSTITLTGNAKATQNGNSLSAEILNYYMSDDIFVAEGKTKAVYYPSEK